MKIFKSYSLDTGKSVTGLSLMRLLPLGGSNEGSIRFQGKELLSISEKDMHKVRGNLISMIFQEPMTSLNPLHTVGKQISESIRLHMQVSRQEAKDKALHILRAVGMPGRRDL